MKKMDMKYLLLLFLYFPIIVYGQSSRDSLQIMNAKWERSTVTKGVEYMHHQFDTLYGMPQDVYLARIDLNCRRPFVCIHQGRQLSSSHASRRKAVVAVNGTYFDMENGNSVAFVANKGKIGDYSNAIGTDNPLTNAAIEIEGKNVKIVPWNDRVEHGYSLNKKSVMVSGPLLIYKGKTIDFTNDFRSHIPTRHPRTAIGLLPDGQMILVVVDGRRTGIAGGVTMQQLAHMLHILGAVSALNLDGGGSSVLWVDGKICNNPSDGQERTVANSLLVR